MDLKNMSYTELAKLQAEVAAEANAKRAEARASALATIVSLITDFGFVGADINKALGVTAKTKKTKGAGTGNRSKVEPKYRDPQTGKTWSGRGVPPVWIKDIPKEDRGIYLIATTEAQPAIPASQPEAVTGEAEEPAVEVAADETEADAPAEAPVGLFSKTA